jgi:hypothetical protein
MYRVAGAILCMGGIVVGGRVGVCKSIGGISSGS